MVVRIYFLIFGFLNLLALWTIFNVLPLATLLAFFTILSNIYATFFFIYLGLSKRQKFSSKFDSFFGASVIYMSITGMGYWLFLRNTPLPGFHNSSPWINIMGHAIMPIAVFVGWLIYSHHNRLKLSNAIKWLFFPIAYLMYSLIAGAITGHYPYFFLNPNQAGGYIGVFGYVLFFTAVAYVIGLGVVWIGNKLHKAGG